MTAPSNKGNAGHPSADVSCRASARGRLTATPGQVARGRRRPEASFGPRASGVPGTCFAPRRPWRSRSLLRPSRSLGYRRLLCPRRSWGSWGCRRSRSAWRARSRRGARGSGGSRGARGSGRARRACGHSRYAGVQLGPAFGARLVQRADGCAAFRALHFDCSRSKAHDTILSHKERTQPRQTPRTRHAMTGTARPTTAPEAHFRCRRTLSTYPA